MRKIVTVCSAGLVRSAALADVLKMHFEPCDVLPVGVDRNDKKPGGALDLLFNWADTIIVMHEPYINRVPENLKHKVILCEVGRDVYHNPRHPELIAKVWNWTRLHLSELQITEHNEKL
jgi:predicted protein tyrosine phosphatase